MVMTIGQFCILYAHVKAPNAECARIEASQWDGWLNSEILVKRIDDDIQECESPQARSAMPKITPRKRF